MLTHKTLLLSYTSPVVLEFEAMCQVFQHERHSCQRKHYSTYTCQVLPLSFLTFARIPDGVYNFTQLRHGRIEEIRLFHRFMTTDASLHHTYVLCHLWN